MRKRRIIALGFSSFLLACPQSAPLQPGTEGGPCIDGECVGALMCLSDLCVDPDGATSSASHGSDDDPSADSSDDGPPADFDNEIDIIFMIDDSGSMGEEQLALVAAIEELVDVLERPGVNANYRIAFTTSDRGNPLCPTTTKQPDDGKFVLSSCRQRQSHFTFATIPPVEAFDPVCAQACVHDVIETQPTTTHADETSRPRPWIERKDGVSNLPPGISTAEAIRCLAPMGIAGCGYEEQLESVYRALLRVESSNEDQYGFIRPNAALAIVLVSDEADGSINRGVGNIYDVNGPKTFWQDPDANFPTSAVSWNAGVGCVGDGLPFDDCFPQNYGIGGSVVSPEQAADQAVLHPTSRYIEQIESIAEAKKALHPDRELVVVAGLLGVPEGYSGSIVYRDDPADPQFVYDFGIGAGCVSSLSIPGLEAFQPKAVPPVRQREFVEHFGGWHNVFSICAQDFSPVIDPILALVEN
jgi:hypothetical protein